MSEKIARPWDLLFYKKNPLMEQIYNERMDICKQCPNFISLIQQCKECGCVMPAKAKNPASECPIGKWHKVQKHTDLSGEQKND
jgi:hypothetical protein